MIKKTSYFLGFVCVCICLSGLFGCNNGSSGDTNTKKNASSSQTDNGSTWFVDFDGDGYGDPETAVQSATRPYGMVSDNTDCNDEDASVHPSAEDIAYDGIDQDCSGGDSDVPGTWEGNYFVFNEEDMEVLSHYAIIEGNLSISSASLTSLNSLVHLTKVTGDLRIYSNPNLKNMEGLENLTSIGGDLAVSSNDSLEEVNAFSNLLHIGKNLRIYFNNSLKNLAGLKNIQIINGYLNIIGNDQLPNLVGLENLESVFGDLFISNNDQLTEVNFSALCYVQGNVSISNFRLFPGKVVQLKNQIGSQCGNNPLYDYCANGLKDVGEDGVDCGGPCPSECTECLSVSNPDFGHNYLYAPYYSFNEGAVQQAAEEAVRKFADNYQIEEAVVFNSADLLMEAVAWYVDIYMKYMHDDGIWGWSQSAGYTVEKSGNRIVCANGKDCDEKVRCNEIEIALPGYDNETIKYCGDCEDFAFLRAALLRHLGVSEACVMVAAAYSPFDGESNDHAFNVVLYKNKYRIMDYGKLGRYFDSDGHEDYHDISLIGNDHFSGYY